MEKTLLFAWILVLNLCTISVVQSKGYWKSYPYEPVKLKKTHLRFFIHDTLSRSNPSAVRIARTNTTVNDNNPISFGSLYAIDDPLTEGPEITSRVIGNARGMYLSSSHDEKSLTLVMYLDLGFTSGKFSGSSLSVFSRNPITEKDREMAIVGGRGKFRFAEGFVKVKTQFLNFTSGDAILEYNVEVVHP